MIVDRSGSMSGRDMERAKEALVMLLNQLPPDNTTFNIISFGSKWTQLWSRAQAYDDDNLATAIQHVQEMKANYGGTEILAPLRAVINEEIDCVRDIIVLTDGSVSNTEQVIQLCRDNKTMNRVWGLGIGSGCSTGMFAKHKL